MPNTDTQGSLLVADIGSVNTKVGWVDRVGNDYRFVAVGTSPTTLAAPYSDLMVGLRRAIEQIHGRTGRRFLTDDGQLITPERTSGQGVDGFAAVTSAAAPLRVAIVGLSRDVSVTSAERAVQGTYATVVATLALDETGGRWLRASTPRKSDTGTSEPALQDPAVIAAEALAQARAQVIVLVGGIDGGSSAALYDLANLIASITAPLDENSRPIVIFAGNRDARAQIAERIGQIAQLHVVDNVHPTLDRRETGALQHELEALYVDRKIGRLAGAGGLLNWTKSPIQPSARAFQNVIRFLSRRYGLAVLGADIGGTATSLVAAQGDSFRRIVRADLGIGASFDSVVNLAGPDAVLRWLPFEMNAEDLAEVQLAYALSPGAIPETRRESRIQQAVAREALGLAARHSGLDANKVDLLLLTGALTSYRSDYGAVTLLALDALQPHGVLTLAADALGLAPALGALALLNPDAAASVIERDGFVTLGTVIAPSTPNRAAQLDLRVQIQPAGSGAMNVEVAHGSLEVVPLASGQKATLEVRAAPGVDLGAAGHRGLFKADVEGGAVGLVIDARGRPVVLPSDPEKRRDKNQKWLWDVGS